VEISLSELRNRIVEERLALKQRMQLNTLGVSECLLIVEERLALKQRMQHHPDTYMNNLASS